MLAVNGIDVFYGEVQALRGVSLAVGEGEIVALVGANGAGKTTVLRAVTGVRPPRSGTIAFRGRALGGLPPHRIARMGVAIAPEGRGIFGNLTVLENLEMGGYARRSGNELREAIARVFVLFPRLDERARQSAATLSGGEQQMLALGRALVAGPALMLLDEPSMGLAPLLVREIFRVIAEINRAGTTILLVEQNAFMALSVAHRAYVLESGAVALAGRADELRRDPKVRAAYLGDASES
jgi:branched-chain amino acid transport system ATP-binding protein